MPVAWLTAAGITSLTGVVLVGHGDSLLLQAATQTSVLGSSLSGGQGTDTANITEVHPTYNVVQHQSSYWPSCPASVAPAVPSTVSAV